MTKMRSARCRVLLSILRYIRGRFFIVHGGQGIHSLLFGHIVKPERSQNGTLTSAAAMGPSVHVEASTPIPLVYVTVRSKQTLFTSPRDLLIHKK